MVESSQVSRELKVLVVEDEREIRELITLLLLRQGYQVQHASSSEEAYEFLNNNKFDLMVLDWMLPQESGVSLLQRLPKIKKSIPVLMVTAKAEPNDIVAGLEAGADDYITKPFEPNIFAARVRALLRRAMSDEVKQEETYEVLKVGELQIDLGKYEVSCCGEKIHMTPSEFKIIAILAQQRGRVLTRDQLIEVVQGEGVTVTGRTVDTHVFGIRKKLLSCSEWIETIRGVGYRIKF